MSKLTHSGSQIPQPSLAAGEVYGEGQRPPGPRATPALATLLQLRTSPAVVQPRLLPLVAALADSCGCTGRGRGRWTGYRSRIARIRRPPSSAVSQSAAILRTQPPQPTPAAGQAVRLPGGQGQTRMRGSDGHSASTWAVRPTPGAPGAISVPKWPHRPILVYRWRREPGAAPAVGPRRAGCVGGLSAAGRGLLAHR